MNNRFKKGRLYYYEEIDNWIFKDKSGNSYALHCVEKLEIKIYGITGLVGWN